ncbi:MAG: ABC transporter substrate-binding protein [Propionibacteriaceae bacterium]|jgi:NitT/TauT family transport system substrate-binding protein|nr:ABC transporter substrate-binding protein [Propionibacteriaceae bacterium]
MFLRFRHGAAASCLALAALGLAACAGLPGADESATPSAGPLSVTMALPLRANYGPWHVAKSAGYFADRDLTVAFKDFQTEDDLVAALESGQADCANTPAQTALHLVEDKAVDAKIVLVTSAARSSFAIVTTSADVVKVADLAGQAVAFEDNSRAELLLDHALSEVGLTPGSITKVQLSTAAAAAALTEEQVAVAVLWEPYISQVKTDEPNARTVYDAGADEGIVSDVLLCRTAALTAQPAAIRALLAAWDDAVADYTANPAAARAVIAQAIGSTVADMKPMIEGLRFYGLAQNEAWFKDQYTWSILPAINDAAVTAGLVKGLADPTQLVDATFVTPEE